MNPFPTSDLALVFIPAVMATDVVIRQAAGYDDFGDLVIDSTAETPLLMSIGCDRRALADDEMPSDDTTLLARRGWVGDALDRSGRLCGSRLWLLTRAKRTEETRQMAEIYLKEALAWLKSEFDLTPEFQVEWNTDGNRATGQLSYQVSVGDTRLAIVKKVQVV